MCKQVSTYFVFLFSSSHKRDSISTLFTLLILVFHCVLYCNLIKHSPIDGV